MLKSVASLKGNLKVFGAAGAAVLALSGCTSLTSKPPMLTTEQAGVLEPIYAAAVTADTAIVRVSSNGCTTRDDMQAYLSPAGGATELTVRRLRGDTCGTPMVNGVELRWTFEELGLEHGEAVIVNNPFRLRDIVVERRKPGRHL